jgi:protein-S-isoprenylcysteine O-methyltransferase Ste14
MERASTRPASVTRSWINLSGLLAAGGSIWLLVSAEQASVHAAMLGILTLALVIGALDLIVNRSSARPSAGLVLGQPNRDWSRLGIKLLGLAATLGLVGLVYWLVPEYDRERYDAFWYALRLTWPAWLVGQLAYFSWLDPRMAQPQDGYWQMGSLVLGRFAAFDRRLLGQHLLGWAIKGFFTPLMFVYLVSELDSVTGLALGPSLDFLGWFGLFFAAAYVIDLVYTTAGYLFSLRLTDSHIRSCDATASGWLVALICYEPFWLFFYDRYWPYWDQSVWSDWLAGSFLLYVWAGLILGLMAIYAWTTSAFGLRFSNLTHRGILTNGPFRFTKHPAYLSKNLVWWLMAMPFLSASGPAAAAKQSLMLLMVNGIYYLRARTEERHLSKDPTYVAYALWINEHGILRRLGRWIPALRYRPPAELS